MEHDDLPKIEGSIFQSELIMNCIFDKLDTYKTKSTQVHATKK